MGAVKNLAIELEGNMEYAAGLASKFGDATLAYRLGLLEACRIINADQALYVGQYGDDGASPFDALSQAWRSVYDAANYLRDVASRDD